MTVAPPFSRLHLVPALLGTALLCVALAWPAVATPPEGKGPAAPTPPGQAKKGAAGGHAKQKAARGQAKKVAAPALVRQSAPQRQAQPKAPPGQLKKSAPASGQAQTSAPAPAVASASSTAQAPAGARSGAARVKAAAARRRAAVRRRAAAAARREAAAATRARQDEAARRAAGAGGAAGRESRDGASGRKDRSESPSWPLTQRDELPQPLRVVRDIVEVVPTPLRVLVAALVALSMLLALASGLTLLRNRRLARQRRELLGEVGLLQGALLPELPETLPSCRASVAYRPADGPGAGGDFYDVLALAAGRTAIVVGDVSGHGRAALGRTALARYTLRAYVEAGLEPREALQIAGSVLTGKLQGDFVTAIVAIHDAADGTLTYATAGHPPPIVISGSAFDPVLVGTAPPLGVGTGTGQRQTTLPFPRGSIACFYTDGLTEARTADGQLGAERLEDLIRELGPDVTAEQVLDRVASSAGTIRDDAAACVIAAEGGATLVRPRVERLELSRAELRGSRLPEFLEACGVRLHRIRAAEPEARAVAREYGGAILRVRMGERADVEVRPPDLPVPDDVAAALHLPN